MTTNKDALGNVITTGSIIAYPGRMSSSMWMNFAVVYRVEESSDWRGYPYTKLYCVRVGGSHQWGDLRTKKVEVTSIDRVLIVSETQLSPFTNEMHATLLEVKQKALTGAYDK